MTTHNDEPRAAPTQPDPDVVGDHLVIDKREFVPGEHPDPHRRHGGDWHFETYFRCIRCGEQRRRKGAFPDECADLDADGAAAEEAESVQ